MSALTTPLRIVARFTGACLAPAAMYVGAVTAHKFSESDRRSENIDTISSAGIGAIIGATLLVGSFNQTSSLFLKEVRTAAKIIATVASTYGGNVCGFILALEDSPSRNIRSLDGAWVALLHITITTTTLFLAIFSTTIHPMLGPIVGGVTSWAITYATDTLLLKI